MNIPEGWALVPTELTPEMLRCADRIIGSDPRFMRMTWNAMLAAAPPAPAAQASGLDSWRYEASEPATCKDHLPVADLSPQAREALQPLSHEDIARVMETASNRAGFVTVERGTPSLFMVEICRAVERLITERMSTGEKP